MLETYAPKILHHVSVLVERLREEGGSVVDATQLAAGFAFNVMRDVTFSVRGDGRALMALRDNSMGMVAVPGHVTWVLWIMALIPNGQGKHDAFMQGCRNIVAARSAAAEVGEVGRWVGSQAREVCAARAGH